MTERYLPVSVYRDKGTDCTNGGVTSPRFDIYMVVPCPDGHITREDVDTRGYLILEPRELGGVTNLVPAGLEGWKMFGGNFVYTSDSRFSRVYGHAPVAVHDRVEH